MQYPSNVTSFNKLLYYCESELISVSNVFKMSSSFFNSFSSLSMTIKEIMNRIELNNNDQNLHFL